MTFDFVQKQAVMIRFTPTLDDATVRMEAAAAATKMEEQRLETEYKASLLSQEALDTQSPVSLITIIPRWAKSPALRRRSPFFGQFCNICFFFFNQIKFSIKSSFTVHKMAQLRPYFFKYPPTQYPPIISSQSPAQDLSPS